MRRFLIFAPLFVLFLVSLFVSAGIALALTQPFLPGDLFFPVQDLAEQSWARSIADGTDRALYSMDLASQRAADLALLSDGKNAGLAVEHLNLALDRVTRSVAAASPAASQKDKELLDARMIALIQQIEAALPAAGQLSQGEAGIYAALRAKVSTLRALSTGDGRTETPSGEPPSDESPAGVAAALPVVERAANGDGSPEAVKIDPRIVAFPPGSPGALHAFFPLTGQHAILECTSCHQNGRYSGTPSACLNCHEADIPAAHFEGDCAACHSAVSWSDVHFDHSLAGTQDCQACHRNDRPNNHYEGQCSICHDTGSWKNATFNHEAAGATDCLACHRADRPADHFEGQCSLCHDTGIWRNATFNHEAAGATDCLACHALDRPRDHFEGQCSLCHATSNWRNATFNHEALGATDCVACHQPDKPDNHFEGQCSNCHSPVSWAGAVFNHEAAGATDCQACHIGDRPENHFEGQCSNCHNTSDWGDAVFDHAAAGATDCQACHTGDRPANHFEGQCSNCHNTSDWGDAVFDHAAAGATDCVACHQQDKPENHFEGQCSNCHNTSDWGDAVFDHTAAGATDCQACHTGDRPANHFEGQCSSCHNTSDWDDASFDHSFPMNHGGAGGDCSACHVSSGSDWTCFTCHDQRKMEEEHREEISGNIAGRCLDCHPNGEEGDD